MIDLDLLLEHRILMKQLTKITLAEFRDELKKHIKNNPKKRKFRNSLESRAKQFLFVKIVENNNISNSLLALLFGESKQSIYYIKKALNPKSFGNGHKYKKIGEFLKDFPDLQDVIVKKNLSLPFQLSSTKSNEEHKRLFKVAITESKRLSVLMMFRREIEAFDADEQIDTFILKQYRDKYAKELGSCSLKELAYLWGVSIEYMTRVLNIALDKLQSKEKELWEKLVMGYE